MESVDRKSRRSARSVERRRERSPTRPRAHRSATEERRPARTDGRPRDRHRARDRDAPPPPATTTLDPLGDEAAAATALAEQYARAWAHWQVQAEGALRDQQEQCQQLQAKADQSDSVLREEREGHERELTRLRQALEASARDPPAPLTTAPGSAPGREPGAAADGEMVVLEGVAPDGGDPAPFGPPPEYEEDFGPTLEVRMFSRAALTFVVLAGGAITTRPTMKDMVASACYRHYVGFPITRPFLETDTLPVFARCAVRYYTSDAATMAAVLQECVTGPSQLVTDLEECEGLLAYNFADVWALLPLLLSWVAPLALFLLVTRHDVPLLQTRRAVIPRPMLAFMLPWLLTAMVYYIAEPLCNLVLLYRRYADVSADLAVWLNVVPRLFLVALFWWTLAELFAKLCYCNSSFSLFYLNPLYFMYPRVPIARKAGTLPVPDPQEYENGNPRILVSTWATWGVAALYALLVTLVAFVVPVSFLEVF